MRYDFDRGTILGVSVLSLMMVGIAATSYFNTQRLRMNAEQVSHSRVIVDNINHVQLDTVRLQADVRAYLVTGFEEAIQPYRATAAKLRSDANHLAEQVSTDSEHHPLAHVALQEIEKGITGFDVVVKMRGEPSGHAAVLAYSRERGPRSFADPLLETLAKMEQIERNRLALREAEAREAYQNAVIYGITAAALGLTAVGLFIWLLAKSSKARAQDKARLASQRELLSSTLSSIGDAVISTDVEGKVTFLNTVAEVLTGWASSDAIGQPLPEVFNIANERTRQPAPNPALEALRADANVGLANNTILIARDGVEHPIDDSAAPIRDGSGIPVGAVLVFRDVTERKRAEEAQARLAAIVESSEDAIISKTLDGIIRSWNTGAEKLFGHTATQAIGQPITLIIPQERQDEERLIMEKLRRGERIEHFETIREARDGSQLHISLSVSPLMDSEGTVIGASKVARDITQRVNAEKDHRQLISLVETSTDLIGLSALDGKIIYFNDAGLKLLGLTSLEEAKSKSVFDFVHPDSISVLEQQMLPALHGKGFWEGEWNYRHAVTGLPVPVSEKVTIIKDPQTDKPFAYATVSRDISERIQADAELRSSEERLRLALDAGGMGFWDWDIVTGKITWSDRINEFYGMQPGEYDGTLETFARHQHPEDADRARRAIRASVKEGAPYLIEYRIVQKGGGIRWVLTSGKVIRDNHGQPQRMIGAARDITERKLADDALRHSEERYRQAAAVAAQAAEANAKFRAFFEQGMNFAGVLSLDGKVMEANHLCLDACGFKREDVIGKYFWECGWWNQSATVMDRVRSGFQKACGRDVFRTETNYFVADGSERIVDLIMTPITDGAGKLLFVAATGTDITDRRHMEDALRAADRNKDEFIALLAHELRNPLAPLRNGLQVMKLAASDTQALHQARAMMDRQLTHMVRLIDDLLDISRINQHKMELRRSRILLSDVVNSALETARPVIEAAQHELQIALPQEPVVLFADLTRLAQVFSNLLTNSSKYTNQGGRIWIAAEKRGDEAVISIRDNGIGIPANALPDIFDMFSQVDRTIERSTGGLGIGLALVKGLVEMHEGTVTVSSEGQDMGSTFEVKLPILKDEEQKPAVTSETTSHSKSTSRKILVVDDNLDSATSMAMMLELLGHVVSTAHDGREAVEVAERFQPQIILMDVGMPKLNGYEATRLIRKQAWLPQPVIIALTGWGQESDKHNSKEAGCDAHLVKPVNLSDLEKTLRDLEPATTER